MMATADPIWWENFLIVFDLYSIDKVSVAMAEATLDKLATQNNTHDQTHLKDKAQATNSSSREMGTAYGMAWRAQASLG